MVKSDRVLTPHDLLAVKNILVGEGCSGEKFVKTFQM
jgi:hypothetical protein